MLQNWISFEDSEPICFSTVFLTDRKKIWLDTNYEWSTYSGNNEKDPTHWISPITLVPILEKALENIDMRSKYEYLQCCGSCEMSCSKHCGITKQ